MRKVLRGAELVGWFVALSIVGMLYMVFVEPDEHERRRDRVRWDD